MAIARGTIDLSDVTAEDFNPELELRVAAVHGDAVLGSTVVQAKRERALKFELEFEPIFHPGSINPCGLRLIVGPNIADRELLGLDVAATTYEFAKAKTPRARKAKLKLEEAEAVEAEWDDAELERVRSEAEKLEVDVGAIAVLPHVYRGWLWCCRVYRIRGKVVCRNWTYDPISHRWGWCDDPVPGAEVDIYDVDRFLWWYREDVITTVTTEFDGTFEASFIWCCSRFPWWDRGWLIDQDILRHIRELLLERNVILKPPLPDPDPTVLQELASSLQPRPVPVPISEPVAPVPTSAASLRRLLPESERLVNFRVWPWWDWEDCQPDVIFRVRQFCNDREEVIHDEGPAQTRWNIPSSLNVTLLANDKACCMPSCRDPECPDCMKLTWVGCSIPIDHIADASYLGPPDLRGYVNVPSESDAPLYGSLQVRGDIGTDIDYFRVQYSKNDGPWTDLPTPQFAGYSRRYWQGTPGFSPYIPFVPMTKAYGVGNVVVIRTRHHYEELNPGLPTFGGDVYWDDWDTLFYFATDALPSLGDGLFELRFIGYAADAGDDLVAGSEHVIRTCGLPTWETVYLRIDNQLSPNHPAVDHLCGGITSHLCVDEPEAYIRSLIKNEGLFNEQPVSVCDIVELEPTDTLTVHFTVTVPTTAEDGHLGGYEMWADYGASLRFYIGKAGVGDPCPAPDSSAYRGIFEEDPPSGSVQVGPSYVEALAQGAPRPHWYGGAYKVTLRGCDFPVCCAYDIYLHGWKRTWNGCNSPPWTHWNQYHNTFTVLRRDLCPEICVDVNDGDHGHGHGGGHGG